MIPDRLRRFLPTDTAATWDAIAAAVPAAAYLVGGTAIAAHLCHRVSQDLDFFLDDVVDLDALATKLGGLGPFATTTRAAGTLNGVFSRTRVQFLDARRHRRVGEDIEVGGLRVASMRDLVAMKLKVVGDRGELRDYFDLMAIEQAGRGTVEAGLGDYLARYRPSDEHASLIHVIEALGYLDDVDEDHLVPLARARVDAYWRRRQPEILRMAGRL